MDLIEIRADIPNIVREWGENNATNTGFSFVSILIYRYGEIVERAFALRRYAKKGLRITEVRRRATGKNYTVVKNLLYSHFCGYIPVFESEDRYVTNNGWKLKVFGKEDFDIWFESDLPCNFYTLCLNKEILKGIDEFKYCGYSGGDVIEYLNKYRENPLIEFFGKFDLPLSPLLISQAKKDKRFKVYLSKNITDVRCYGSRATIYAYKHNMTIPEAAGKIDKERRARKNISALRGRKLNAERIIDYCNANNIGFRVYNDYLEAVIALGLDLQDTKNIYPKDFDRMHDLRITEYESQKAKADRVNRKELYESFAKAGEKATAYEYSDNDYSMIAPRDIRDLVLEGKLLNHCVGKMGYDKKMADGKVVIMFLRHTEDITKPFVTIEYDLTHLKLLQAYAKGNTNPPSDAMEFINKWQKTMKNLKGKKNEQLITVR